MRSSLNYLNVGHVGSLPIRIPVVTVGAGSPVLSILCGVHGDETTSVMASYIFLEKLRSKTRIKGTVRVIPSANPFAQATNSRVALSDFQDLNRTGSGNSKGTQTERIASLLFEFLQDSAMVIDLHEFEMHSPTMGIYLPHKNKKHDIATRRAIAAFKPNFVWPVFLSQSEQKQYSGSLIEKLINSGVPGFGIETTNALLALDGVIEDIADGLYRVTQELNIVDGKLDLANVDAFSRQVYTADFAGIWIPKARVFDNIKSSTILGRIISIDLQNQETITAPESATILQLAPQKMVNTGSNLYALGHYDKRISKALQKTEEKMAN